MERTKRGGRYGLIVVATVIATIVLGLGTLFFATARNYDNVHCNVEIDFSMSR